MKNNHHRRTKSSGNYFPIQSEFLVQDDDDDTNETRAIIKKIQQQPILHHQIVEKLDDQNYGLFNTMFNFGQMKYKPKQSLDLSTITECSCKEFIYSQLHPQLKMLNLNIENGGSQEQQVNKQPIRHNHSQSLQIHRLEQELEQMKVQQAEIQNVNVMLIIEIHKSRQELQISQQKNELILQRIRKLEKMLKDDQKLSCTTNDSLEFS
ncbi:unnamed protein product (macronuclear) [Paramecium tetraurelia]|uniref:Uncharacterized protein n=1 Tax=Paramecium tetraurelia TaxID=5888 RepID=A0EB80_PARTE|nr:uncharacterized protein GSPATT00025281001 [Paramecium tetraurelia]CAK92547.1 unnamed protein product [Paramecium tetraurelia]|eukprot:XP_001459944.1 hypothetical protein (macronuclear) [Paramecium tetraurelia strain d4-2]